MGEKGEELTCRNVTESGRKKCRQTQDKDCFFSVYDTQPITSSSWSSQHLSPLFPVEDNIVLNRRTGAPKKEGMVFLNQKMSLQINGTERHKQVQKKKKVHIHWKFILNTVLESS